MEKILLSDDKAFISAYKADLIDRLFKYYNGNKVFLRYELMLVDGNGAPFTNLPGLALRYPQHADRVDVYYTDFLGKVQPIYYELEDLREYEQYWKKVDDWWYEDVGKTSITSIRYSIGEVKNRPLQKVVIRKRPLNLRDRNDKI